MNEASLLRALRQYRKVRGPDFHQPATRRNQGKIENGVGGVEKRQPLTKEERAEAEKALAAAAAAGGGGLESAHTQQALPEGDAEAGVDADIKRLDLIDPVDFLKEFDAWVDGKYPGDRGSSTKVKVAFRKTPACAMLPILAKTRILTVTLDLRPELTGAGGYCSVYEHSEAGQHRAVVSNLNLEDIEEIAQAMQ